MEKLLLKLAQQLDAIDEASLMELWSKYATLTERFEPTRRWEENALIFSLIQAKHWKNQLFNYMFAKTSRPQAKDDLKRNLNFGFSIEQPEPAPLNAPQQNTCRILQFKNTTPKSEQDDN